MIFQLFFRELAAILHLIQQDCDFIGLQANDLLIMQLWQGYQRGRIILEQFCFVKIVIKAAQRGKLS